MAKIIEAKAVITADDKTGPAFDAVAKKINRLGKSSKEVDQLSAAMKRAREQMAAIDRFSASRGTFEAARRNFSEAKVAVEGAARALASAKAPTRELESNLQRAQRAVAAASREFDRQKTAVLANKRALETMGVPINRAVAHQARLRAEVERTTHALRRQEMAAERRANRRVAVAGAAAYGGHLAAHGVRHATRSTLHTYREFDKERRYGKVVMGLTDAQQKPLVDQAIHMGATTRYNDVQVLEAQRDLAARGLTPDQVMGVIEPAANLGQSLDLDLPSAVKQIEGALFGFKRDLSTREAAVASARRTADQQVAASKASGMTPEDLVQLYKFGATPARLVGLSEASLLAFGGISKKANIGGDESGVAFRQMMASLVSPTRKAKETLLANGLNFKDYQKMPRKMAIRPFTEAVAAAYGVRLDKKTQLGLRSIFANNELINDPAKFTPAVVSFLKGSLGGRDAKSLKSISGLANRYRDASVSGLDINALMRDLLTKLPGNQLLANAIFGPKQGARIATALGDPATLQHILDIVQDKSEGRAEEIAKERMAGFDGAVSRFEGAVMNLQTAVGSALDGGRAGGGLLTQVADRLAKATQWLAEQDPRLVGGGAVAAGVGGLGLAGFTAYRFLSILTTGGGLTASAVALDGSAAALSAAAAKLAGGSIGGLPAGGKPAAVAKSSIWSKVPAVLPFVGAVGIGAAAYLGSEYLNDASGITRESERARRKKQAAKYTWWGKYDPDGAAARQLGPLAAMPEVSPTMLHGTGIRGQLSGTVTGTVESTVKVEAGSTLLQVVEQAQQIIRLAGTLNANGPGSTGWSSPDAAAPSTGASGSW